MTEQAAGQAPPRPLNLAGSRAGTPDGHLNASIALAAAG
jgi:hypothetical protein